MRATTPGRNREALQALIDRQRRALASEKKELGKPIGERLAAKPAEKIGESDYASDRSCH